MSVIRILSEKVASQIAAGEVIERPASVVKELVDNSIDAGADRISVEIENGGKKRIKVTDNGTGMNRDDLLLCVERHATSKLDTLSDLFRVRSMGFRGEALPSIGSVAKVEITTRRREDISGRRLSIAGGRFINIEEAGCPPGTGVDVRDLFFNVPARRKFLRAVRTETGYITEVLLRTALPFTGIHFSLDDGGRNALHLPVSREVLQRIASILGTQVAESITGIEEEAGGFSVRAYLSHAEFSRSRGDRLLIYVNGRNVRDRLVYKAVMDGYGQRLMKGRYPQAVVMLDMDPSEVDINVHPAKQEVRFLNGKAVYEKTVSVITKALSRGDRVLADIPWERAGSPGQDMPFGPEVSDLPWQYHIDMKGPVSSGDRGDLEDISPDKGIRIIGQLRNTYIICEVDDGLLLLDQHAAHERVVYEGLKKGYKESRIESQRILIPHELELSPKEKAVFFEKNDCLARLGFEIEHFGGDTFLLRSMPAMLSNVQWKSFLPDLLLRLDEGDFEKESVMDGVLIVMACHGSIRAGQRMLPEEMEHLVDQLRDMDLPENCPHGRPIFKRFKYYEIEKMFRRVV